jgi:hypothetical protein
VAKWYNIVAASLTTFNQVFQEQPMTENQAIINDANPKTKKVPIQERSVLVGDMIVVNGHGVNRTLLKQRFAEGGYQAQETPHFLLFTRSQAPTTILVHAFAPEEMNADIKHYVMYELKPLGLLRQSRDFGEILAGIVGSFFLDDARAAWHGFGANTFRRFLLFLSTAQIPPVFNYYATIGVLVWFYSCAWTNSFMSCTPSTDPVDVPSSGEYLPRQGVFPGYGALKVQMLYKEEGSFREPARQGHLPTTGFFLDQKSVLSMSEQHVGPLATSVRQGSERVQINEYASGGASFSSLNRGHLCFPQQAK